MESCLKVGSGELLVRGDGCVLGVGFGRESGKGSGTHRRWGLGGIRVRVRVRVRVSRDGYHVRSSWVLILTLAYITKRLREKERKERDLVGGQTALLIYSEGRGLHASDPLPYPAPSSRIHILHQPSPAPLGCSLPSTASFRLPPASTAFCHHLPFSPPSAPVGRDRGDILVVTVEVVVWRAGR